MCEMMVFCACMFIILYHIWIILGCVYVYADSTEHLNTNAYLKRGATKEQNESRITTNSYKQYFSIWTRLMNEYEKGSGLVMCTKGASIIAHAGSVWPLWHGRLVNWQAKNISVCAKRSDACRIEMFAQTLVRFCLIIKSLSDVKVHIPSPVDSDGMKWGGCQAIRAYTRFPSTYEYREDHTHVSYGLTHANMTFEWGRPRILHQVQPTNFFPLFFSPLSHSHILPTVLLPISMFSRMFHNILCKQTCHTH